MPRDDVLGDHGNRSPVRTFRRPVSHGGILSGLSVGEIGERGLWSELDSRLTARSLADARVLVVGFRGAEHRDLLERLRATGVVAITSDSDVGQLEDAAGMCGSISHLVVNVDAFPGIEAGVDALLAFRRLCRSVTVVLVSSAVVGDDFGLERKSICDVTLRAPLTQGRLRRGLVEGAVNNAEFHRHDQRDGVEMNDRRG